MPRAEDAFTFPAPHPTLDSMELAARWGVSGFVAEFCVGAANVTTLRREIAKRLAEVGALRDMLAVRVPEEALRNLGAALADVGYLWALGEMCWWAALAVTTPKPVGPYFTAASWERPGEIAAEYLRASGNRDALLAAAAAGALEALVGEAAQACA